MRGGVDGCVPVAEVDLGLAVDGANVLAVWASMFRTVLRVGPGVLRRFPVVAFPGLVVGSVSQGLWA